MPHRMPAMLAPATLAGAFVFLLAVPAPLRAACLPSEPVAFAPVAVADPREAFTLQSGTVPGGGSLWSAVALRTGPTHVLTLFDRATGGAEPTCFSLPLSADIAGGSMVALLVGRDTSRTVPGPFADAERVSGTAGGSLHFGRAFDIIIPGAASTPLAFGTDDVVALWRCPIEATGMYRVELAPTSGTGWDVRVVNWQVEPGDWFPLGVASPDSSGPLAESFVGAAGSEVLIAVVKSAAGSGTATLMVGPSTVAVGDGVGPRTRLVGIAPNPSFGSARLSFETAHAGEATIRIVDVAGRRVAQGRLAVAGGGPQVVELSRFVEGRLPSGLYFVSLEFAGRAMGSRRLVVLGAGS